MIRPARWGLTCAMLAASGGCGQPESTTEGVTTKRSNLFFGQATSVAAGGFHSCALMNDSSVRCWGRGGAGALGNGSTDDSATPVAVSRLTDATAISAGELYTCALRLGGRVACWGFGGDGQLGNGGTDDSSEPITLRGVFVTDVAAGTFHTCAVSAGGNVFCWGTGGAGQLGNGTSGLDGFSTVPVEVSGLDDAVDVAVGFESSCAVSILTGRVSCWGFGGSDIAANGPYSPLGTGSTTSSSVPVPVMRSAALPVTGAVAIAAGQYHNCALLTSGGVACWGNNAFGQLGDGSTDNTTRAVVVSGLDDAVAITAGQAHTCALRAGGQIVCWGYGGFGQLGNGSTSAINSTPAAVHGISDAIAVSAGESHTCAVRRGGEVLCWGEGSFGRLGNGGDSGASEPEHVVGLSDNIGEACAVDGDCASNHCTDGVCCDSTCGGGDPDDCQACSVAAGGSGDGTCSLLPISHICRPSTGICDVSESCTSTSPDCPVDRFAPNTTVCHPAAGACDIAEVCSGDAPDCPTDVLVDTGTTCYTRPNLCASVEATLTCSGAPVCPSPTPWGAGDCSSTPSGTSVGVDLDGGSGAPGGVTLNFSDVTSSGETAVVDSGTGCPPPTGFQVLRTGQLPSSGAYWNIDTTATFSGTVRICFHYDQDSMPEGGALEQSLRIVHGTSTACDGTGWTVLLNQTRDMVNNIICGDTTSLSPFAIVAPMFFGVPDTIVAQATSTAGAAVTYAPPQALYFVDGPRPVACAPLPGSTFEPGKNDVTCTASDAGGNPSSVTFTVWVQYEAPAEGAFFLQPINPDGSSIFKRGATVPVKFKLQGASAGITDLVASLFVAQMSNNVTGTYDEAVPTSAADRGNTFRYDASSMQYIFNLSTKNLSTGTWSLRADLGDGVDHVVRISLR